MCDSLKLTTAFFFNLAASTRTVKMTKPMAYKYMSVQHVLVFSARQHVTSFEY